MQTLFYPIFRTKLRVMRANLGLQIFDLSSYEKTMGIKHYLTKDFQKLLKLLKSHLTILSIIIFSYITSYFMNVFLSKILSPRDYGNIAVVMQILTFSIPFALLGTELSIVYYLPKYIAEKNYSKTSGYLRWTMQVYLYASLIVFILGTLIALLTFFGQDGSIGLKEQYHIAIYSYWLIPLFALLILLSQLLQAIRHIYLSTSLSGFAFCLAVIGFTVLFLFGLKSRWLHSYSKQLIVLLSIGAACLMIIAVQIYSIKKVLPAKLFTAVPSYSRKKWTKHSFEMMSNAVVLSALSAIDIFMIEIFGKNELQVAYFAAILVITTSINVFGSAVNVFITPLISPYISQGNHDHLQSILHITNLFKLLPSFLITLLIFFFGKNLLGHFGEIFKASYPSLIIMGIGFFINLCLSASGLLLIYSGHQKINMVLSLCELLAIIILDYFFIPLYGIIGATLVLSITLVVAALIRCYFANKYLRIRTFYFV